MSKRPTKRQVQEVDAPSVSSLVWLFAFTIFVGAFLLFQVQPVMSRMILPWFGGAPSVWTTCMLFFQVALLAGYAYAHFVAKLASIKHQVVVHVGLLLLALCVLPITPGAEWKPVADANPAIGILGLLARYVGLPYLLLASTGPLLQAWYARRFPGKSPYRLYALSNLASFGALLSYPLVFEPWLTTSAQGGMWSWAFGGFVLLCAGVAWVIWDMISTDAPQSAKRSDSDSPSKADVASWILYPMLACVALLAITNHLSMDVAVIPLIWVVPLSIYLLSFVLTFDRPHWYRRSVYTLLLFVAVAFVSVQMRAVYFDLFYAAWSGAGSPQQLAWKPSHVIDSLTLQTCGFLVVLALICIVCHGETILRKPDVKHLTKFYLSISAGGAAGGVFVSLICPLIFSHYWETHLMLLTAYALGAITFTETVKNHPFWAASWKRLTAAVVMILVSGLVVFCQYDGAETDSFASARNFYGVLQMQEMRKGEYDSRIQEVCWTMRHGRIMHGLQWQSENLRRTPTAYYQRSAGVGVTLKRMMQLKPKLNVGVVGLGAGTLATYGRAADQYTFYEINPQVIEFAQDHFTFLSDSAAKTDVILGDARLSLESQEPQAFDVLVLDAFSSDSIPVHLLTNEAFQIYLQHLTQDGVILAHISNRHLDLTPVIAKLAQANDVYAATVLASSDDSDSADILPSDMTTSTWILVTRDESLFQDPYMQKYCMSASRSASEVELWTDQFSNVLSVLKSE